MPFVKLRAWEALRLAGEVLIWLKVFEISFWNSRPFSHADDPLLQEIPSLLPQCRSLVGMGTRRTAPARRQRRSRHEGSGPCRVSRSRHEGSGPCLVPLTECCGCLVYWFPL
ncbi:hypothetical protein AAZX31_08G173700 [Glycine max]|nr:hypothetical protein GLYMA_08G175650v4 [Glycine max]KAH1051742.1 hypothetical protein GYH30_021570 [Glycine max]